MASRTFASPSARGWGWLPKGWTAGAGRPLRAGLGLAAALAFLGCLGGGGSSHPPGPPPRTHWPAPQPTTLPLHIETLYLTQMSQRIDRSVPLVQGRDAYLRVFVLARAWSGPGPEVTARLLDASGHELRSWVIPAPGPGVPTTIMESVLDKAWTQLVPGDLIRPGVRIQATVAAPPGVETGSLAYPADGSALPLNVVVVPPLRITLIPVRVLGKVGRVTGPDRTLASWVDALKRDFPLDDVQVTLGPVHATSQRPFSSSFHSDLLRELNDFRQLSSANDYRYFFGVFPEIPGDRVVGLGYTPPWINTSSRAAIGYDGSGRIFGENYPEVLNHEVGHNLGLLHAPCPPQGIEHLDPNFPYEDGSIGACGFDVEAGLPKDPLNYRDIMSYCSPKWSSDYDCKFILNFRQGDPMVPKAALRSEEVDCLMVRGTLRQGRFDLEPAFGIHRAPPPPDPGELMLSVLDARGHALANAPFAIQPIEDGGEVEGGFTVIVPLSKAMQEAVAMLRVSRGETILAERHGAPGAAAHGLKAGFQPRAARESDGLVQLQWDAAEYPEVIVRDLHGEALNLGGGGRIEVATGSHELDCFFSDGLHTREVRVRVAR